MTTPLPTFSEAQLKTAGPIYKRVVPDVQLQYIKQLTRAILPFNSPWPMIEHQVILAELSIWVGKRVPTIFSERPPSYYFEMVEQLAVLEPKESYYGVLQCYVHGMLPQEVIRGAIKATTEEARASLYGAMRAGALIGAQATIKSWGVAEDGWSDLQWISHLEKKKSAG